MSASLSIEVMTPAALGPAERSAWAQFRAASPLYRSPYFDLRYVAAAGLSAPQASVAVIHRGGRIAAFFPFQRRGGAIHPLGAPMTDYHGVLAAPGEAVDLKRLTKALGARSLRFTGLAGSVEADRGLHRHRTLAVDLTGGYEAWLDRRQALHPRFFKGRRRNVRALERDLGPLAFCWSREEQGLLDYVIGLKRAQYRRTRRHDIFACGWTERMLRALLEAREPDFGLGFAVLRAGETLLAAEVALLGGPTYHLWLPVYETAYARYGPGMLMTLQTLEAVAKAGVTQVDFGRDDADYKAYLSDPAGTVTEGYIAAGGSPLSAMADRALAAGPLRRLDVLRARARRRFDVIAACETSPWGWACGAALAVGLAAQGAAPPLRPHLPAPRRPDAQRTHPGLVGSPEDGLPSSADDLRAPAA